MTFAGIFARPRLGAVRTPSPQDELCRLRSSEDSERDEARSRTRRDVHFPGPCLVEPRHERGPGVSERDTTTWKGDANLTAMQMTAENQVERRPRHLLGDSRKMAEQETKPRSRLGQFVRPSALTR